MWDEGRREYSVKGGLNGARKLWSFTCQLVGDVPDVFREEVFVHLIVYFVATFDPPRLSIVVFCIRRQRISVGNVVHRVFVRADDDRLI
jgi:hypothetical protein